MRWNPEALSQAAEDLSRLGASIVDRNAVDDVPTTLIPAAGADAVSTAVASLVNQHGVIYQGLAARAEAFHGQFIANLASSLSSYQSTEATSANALRSALTDAEQRNSTAVISPVTQIPSTADPVT